MVKPLVPPMVDILGPYLSTPQSVSSRPGKTGDAAGAGFSWLKDCTDENAEDGTPLGAEFLNNIKAQLLTAYIDSNISIDDADDMLSRLFRSREPAGQCQLRYVSATSITLFPKGGDRVKVAGKLVQLPSGGIAAANTGVSVNGVAGQNLAANTAYLVALNAAGTLEFWAVATGHFPDTTAGNIGVEVITGHPDKTLVGMVYTNASAQFSVSASYLGVISWFNRRALSVTGTNTAGAGTASTSFVELTTSARIFFCAWAEEVVDIRGVGQCYNNTSGNSAGMQIGLDNVQVGYGGGMYASIGGQNSFTGAHFTGSVSEGAHYATPFGAIANAGGGFFQVQVDATVRG